MIMTEQAALFTVMEITLLIYHILKAKSTAGPIAGNLSEEILHLVGQTHKFCISLFSVSFQIWKARYSGA